jgi:hypothetical protein
VQFVSESKSTRSQKNDSFSALSSWKNTVGSREWHDCSSMNHYASLPQEGTQVDENDAKTFFAPLAGRQLLMEFRWWLPRQRAFLAFFFVS